MYWESLFEHACIMTMQDLTKSTVHPMGGQAYLSLENSEDPFLHGIKFTAMPPSKRFREMEQLSGGEKVTCLICDLLACRQPVALRSADRQSTSDC